MANRKISDLTALTAPASGDLLPIVDISEAAAADKNKKITIQSLFQGIPVNVGIGTSSPAVNLDVVSATGTRIRSSYTNDSGSRDAGFEIYGDISGSFATRASFTYTGNSGLTSLGSSLDLAFSTASTERARIDSSGRLLVGTSADSGGALLQVNGDRIRIGTAKTPASATATGTTGEIAWDANYIYVCTATNTWKRTAIATW